MPAVFRMDLTSLTSVTRMHSEMGPCAHIVDSRCSNGDDNSGTDRANGEATRGSAAADDAAVEVVDDAVAGEVGDADKAPEECFRASGLAGRAGDWGAGDWGAGDCGAASA